MSVPAIRLAIHFNHRFDRNLAALDRLYADRFEGTRYLMPFYRGERRDVVPVYCSSEHFQGAFAQGYRTLAAADGAFTHWAFVGDDLLLNPRFDATSLAAALGLDPRTGYTKSLTPLADVHRDWPHLLRSLRPFEDPERRRFVHYEDELPTREEARRRLGRHGLAERPLTWRNLAPLARPGLRRKVAAGVALARGGLPRELPYPLLMGYSDLVVVPRAALAEFCHLCGVFAAMGLWVECAAPTALALACERVRVERDLGGLGGVELWSPAEVAALEEEAGLDLARLFVGARRDLLYVHPVKLSRWRAT